MAPTYNEAVTQLYHSSYFPSVNDAQTYLKREKQETLMIVQTLTYYQHKHLYYVVTRLLELFSATCVQ